MSESPLPSTVWLVAAVCLPASLAPLNSTMVAVALPEATRALHADSGAVRQALVTSYLLTNIVLQSPGGKLGDLFGHRRTLAFGQLMFAVGAALAYILPTLPLLTLARVIMAGGGAVVVPSAMALLRIHLPPERRGRAFGSFGALMALSAATGPKVGAVLVERFGWESIFIANVPVLLVAMILAKVVLRGGLVTLPAAVSRPRFDIVGSILLGASLGALVIGSESERLQALIPVGVFGLVPFALWERKARDPVVKLALFARPAFLGGTLVIALHNVAMYSLVFELPEVASRLFQASARDIGSALFSMMATMVVTAPLAGRVSDRFGPRFVAFAGSVVALCGMLMLAHGPFDSVSDTVLPLVLLGFGLGAAAAPSQVAAINSVRREESGMASGVASTMRYLGAVIGLAVLGFVLSDTAPPEITRREHFLALHIFAGALGLAAVCSLMLSPPTGARALE